MKYIVAVILLLAFGIFLTEYTKPDKPKQTKQERWTSRSSGMGLSVICLDGVEYWTAPRNLAVKYNTDGTISLCKEK